MLSKVAGFISRNQIMQGTCEEREVAVIIIRNGIGERLVAQWHQVLKIDIERRKIVDAQAMDLSDVVLVAARRARRGSSRRRDGVFDEPVWEHLSWAHISLCHHNNNNGAYHNSVGGDIYWSKKLSNSSATFSPTRSTTLGTACAIGSRGRFRSVPRTPTTSSSGNPSASLSGPLISDGGP